jgi:hypothetical protein
VRIQRSLHGNGEVEDGVYDETSRVVVQEVHGAAILAPIFSVNT